MQQILAAKQMHEGSVWRRHRFQPNSVIVKKGELGKSLFFVEEGILRVLGDVELQDNKKIRPGVFDLDCGTIFGEVCLDRSQIRSATVVAISEVVLIEVDGRSLSVYLDDNPLLGYLFYKELFEIMMARLGKANQRVANLMGWGLQAHSIDKYL